MDNKRKLAMLISLVFVFYTITLFSPNSSSAPQAPVSEDSPSKGEVGSTSEEGLLGQPENNEQWQPQAKISADKLAGGNLNILLLGIDARAKETSRSDSMILLSINPKTDTAAVLSILRDTYVTIPTASKPKYRINTAYSLGGASLTVKTVSSFLQVPIKYYVVADFQGFEKAIDALGGVEIDVEKRMDYVDDGVYDIHLKPGRQLLTGAQALGYARFRHDERGDFARVERQRKVVEAALAKMQSIQGLYYLPRVYEAVRPYIKSNLDLTTAAGLMYLGCRIKTLNSKTIPEQTDLKLENIDGMDVLLPNEQQVRSSIQKALP